MRLKSKEALENLVKREIINGMSFNDIQKLHSIKRSKLTIINSRITAEDVKNFKGETFADCVPEDIKEKIIEFIKSEKTSKWISQQTGYPTKVIAAIGKIYNTKANIPSTSSNEISLPEPAEEEKVSPKTTPTKPYTYAKNVAAKKEMGKNFYDEFKTGKSVADIAAENNMSVSTIRRYIQIYKDAEKVLAGTKVVKCHSTNNKNRKKREPTSRAQLTKEQVIEISEMIIRGFTNTEIASAMHANPVTISRIRCKKAYCTWTADYVFDKKDFAYPIFLHSEIKDVNMLNQIIDLLMAGHTDKYIADKFEFKPHVVACIRNHKSFCKFTEGMKFPDPIDEIYYSEINAYTKVKDETSVEQVEEAVPVEETAPDIEEPVVEETAAPVKGVEKVKEVKTEPQEATPSNGSFCSHTNYKAVAKTVAGDNYHIGVVVVVDDTIISSARFAKDSRIDPVVIAIMKVN